MTSRRTDDSRKQWADFSAKRRAAELAGAGDVYGAIRRCPDCRIELASVPDGGCQRDDCPYRPHEAKVRAKPVQTEQTHAQLLATRAYRQWWYPGFTCIEHRSSHWRETDQRSRSGVKTGLPDYLMLIPPYRRLDGERIIRDAYLVQVRCALELKAPEYRPKRDPGPEWWLEDWGDAASRYGVRRDQAFWLRTMAGCGFRTKVAYGADEALAWLCEVAGPRPDVLPEGWG